MLYVSQGSSTAILENLQALQSWDGITNYCLSCLIQTTHPCRAGLIQSHKTFIRRWIPTWSQTPEATEVRAALLPTLRALLQTSGHRDLWVQTLWDSSRKSRPKRSGEMGKPTLVSFCEVGCISMTFEMGSYRLPCVYWDLCREPGWLPPCTVILKTQARDTRLILFIGHTHGRALLFISGQS